MAIPDYQTIMLPFLKALSDLKEHSTRELIEDLAKTFRITDEERKELLAGGQPVFNNRVGWARMYLKKAQLIESPRRGLIDYDLGVTPAAKHEIKHIDHDYLGEE